MNRPGPWRLATVALAALIILDLLGILRPLRGVDLSEFEQLEKKLSEERSRRDSMEKINLTRISILEHQNDSLVQLDSTNEIQKHENTQIAEDVVRYLRDAPLDSVGVILTREAPAGY
tara:strand:- start:12466 stop:12819 length:354 start_codon:yes stop_codon:yes gene_type:complete